LESLGFDEWTAQHTAALRNVVDACPHCSREWSFFQQSILIVSTTSQILPSPDQTRLMWQTCSTQIRLHPTERGVEPRVLISNPTASDTAAGKVSAPFWSGWFVQQPALGWAALGAAGAIFLGVWLLTPETSDVEPPMVAVAPLPELQNANDLEALSVSYQRPPAMASALVNNHSMMSSGPFSNYVGGSLVSYSAVAPPARP